eukprot:gene8583-11598_t
MRYNGKDVDALSNINIFIAAGSRVAVVGRTGSGKSTLLRVLLRLNEIQVGNILLGGVNLSSINELSFRRQLSVIPQSPVLLHGTLRYNMDPYNEYSDYQIMKELRKSQYFETFSNNHLYDARSDQSQSEEQFNSQLLDTMIVDGGSGLSLGQRQLICMSRAILKRSNIILIDEATSSIDAKTESLLHVALEKHVREIVPQATIIMICHKMGGIAKLCDKTLTMKDGKIVSYK